jgi:hypothetical protein
MLISHGRTKRRKAQKRIARDITNNQSQKAKGTGEGLYCPGGDCPKEEGTRGEFLTSSGSGSLEC